MPMNTQDSILNKIMEGADSSGGKLKEAAPQVLIEILYEYLSQSISVHFEKTVEGLETVHESLIERKAEHAELFRRLSDIEQRLASIELLLSPKQV